MTVNPDKVTITGPESILDQIDRAVALIDVEGLAKDSEETAKLGLYDISATRSVRHGWEIILARAALLCLLKC